MTFFAPRPRELAFCECIKLFKDTSSKRCDSSVVEESELESIDGAKVSFFDPVSLERQRDFDFSALCEEGRVFFLDRGTGSNEIADVEVSLRESGGCSMTVVGNDVVEKRGRGASTESSSTDGSSDLDKSV